MKTTFLFNHFKNINSIIILCAVFVFAINHATAQQFDTIDKIPLQHFLFREANKANAKWLNAKVPGTIHTDLLKNKIIPEPYFADNETQLQWIEQKDWEYQTEFFISNTQFNKKNMLLVFDGLDTYADIYVNNIFLGKVDNMFCKWEFEIKKIIK